MLACIVAFRMESNFGPSILGTLDTISISNRPTVLLGGILLAWGEGEDEEEGEREGKRRRRDRGETGCTCACKKSILGKKKKKGEGQRGKKMIEEGDRKIPVL